MMNLISICIPVYNVAPYLKDCIKSILVQTYRNIEMILVDDGSTDDSGDICDAMAEMDHRIKVIHKQNGGSVTARKAALSVAKGDYVGFVDSDDCIEPEMFEVLLNKLISSKADFVISGINYHKNDRCSYIGVNHDGIIDVEADQKQIWQMFFGSEENGNRITHHLVTKLFPAEMIKRNFNSIPDECVLGEDGIATIKCLCESKKIAVVSKAFYHYIPRKTSITEKKDTSMFFLNGLMYYHFFEILKRYNKLETAKEYFDKSIVRNYAGMINVNSIYPHRIQLYEMPNISQRLGTCEVRIVLYGAGSVGQDIYQQLSSYTNIRVVRWVDKNALNISNVKNRVYPIHSIFEEQYDSIVVAVLAEELAESIKGDLMRQGVPADKIYWEKPLSVV